MYRQQELRGVSTPHTPFRLTHRFASHTVSPHTPFRLTPFQFQFKKMRFQEFHLLRTVKKDTDTQTNTQTD